MEERIVLSHMVMILKKTKSVSSWRLKAGFRGHPTPKDPRLVGGEVTCKRQGSGPVGNSLSASFLSVPQGDPHCHRAPQAPHPLGPPTQDCLSCSSGLSPSSAPFASSRMLPFASPHSRVLSSGSCAEASQR